MMWRNMMTVDRRNTAIAVLALALWFAPGFAGAADLEDIEVLRLPGQEVQLTLLLNGPAPEPLSFTIDDPARIALDLPGTSLALEERRKDVGVGGLRSILAAEASGRTRVVLNLDNLMPYSTRVSGNRIIVTLGGSAVAEAAAAAPTFTGTQPTQYTGPRAITDIDFRRGRDGAGRVVVTLSDPNTTVDVREEAGRIFVTFRDTELPASLMRRLDVLDFATPVQVIDATEVYGDTRITILATGDYVHLAYQSDDQFALEVSEKIEEDAISEQQKVYTGQRLTLNFQDIETRAVLQLLADTSGMNIVVSDSVQGNVTLRLQNVPWDQALDIVMKTKGLDMRHSDNVIIVAPAEELAAREQAELQARQERQELEPLYSEYVQVNYAKAAQLADLIGSGEASLLSSRGTVAIDERTNTLLVKDTAESLEAIRRMVRTLDIPVRQVLIESRIVIASDDFAREIGVRFGYTYVTDNTQDGIIAFTGNSQGTDTMVTSALDNIQNTGQPFPVELPELLDRFNVNAPIASPVGSFGLAILDGDYLLDLELSALQAEGRGELISTPRVVTANQKEAYIEQGVEIPYQEASSSGATTTQFKKAVLRLQVTPHITPDNRIIMDLLVNNDTVGEIVPSGQGGFVPSIDTNEVATQVLVNDGETVVLGGIYVTERRETENKVPFLGDIPGIGWLFKSTQRTYNKSELLIFITPKILHDGAHLEI